MSYGVRTSSCLCHSAFTPLKSRSRKAASRRPPTMVAPKAGAPTAEAEKEEEEEEEEAAGRSAAPSSDSQRACKPYRSRTTPLAAPRSRKSPPTVAELCHMPVRMTRPPRVLHACQPDGSSRLALATRQGTQLRRPRSMVRRERRSYVFESKNGGLRSPETPHHATDAAARGRRTGRGEPAAAVRSDQPGASSLLFPCWQRTCRTR